MVILLPLPGSLMLRPLPIAARVSARSRGAGGVSIKFSGAGAGLFPWPRGVFMAWLQM